MPRHCASAGANPARQLFVPAVMLSISLCGVGPENPCCITLLANLTPHSYNAGPVRGMVARRVSQAAPRCRRCQPDPTRPSVRHRAPPWLTRGGGPARGAPSWAARARMLGGGLGLAPRGGPGTAASEAGQGSRSGHESGPYVLAFGDAGVRCLGTAHDISGLA